MKILTWNLMRPNSKTAARNETFISAINEVKPEIAILTETNSVIDFSEEYHVASTTPLPEMYGGYKYHEGENRITIFSKYPITKQIATADSFTSVCAELATPHGQLIVYGTIIGFLGGKHPSFAVDLEQQIKELTNLAKQGDICFAGDLNISFSGYPYPSKAVIESVAATFQDLSLTNVTKDLEDSAIHNVFSNSFLADKKISVTRQTFDKLITDHNLVVVELESNAPKAT